MECSPMCIPTMHSSIDGAKKEELRCTERSCQTSEEVNRMLIKAVLLELAVNVSEPASIICFLMSRAYY